MENFDKYAEYTKSENWGEICRLNGVELDSFGTKKELRVLSEYLEADEVVFALTSGIMDQTETSNSFDFGSNTWLVVLTSDRFLFLDHAMLTKSVDTQSIRHDHVQAVSASQGFMFGKIMIDLGSRMLVIDNAHKSTVKVIASLANKWLKELADKKSQPTASANATYQTPLFDMLERLDKLATLGALTDEEFEYAKQRLIASEQFQAEKARFLSSLPQ
ncbi:PH domain-containing protein [Psychrobacter sp. FDAARGOS_221]|uniref:PH domain-containing protein n=1 Tax=Psychrobacter sp. FDAARGOS_221 TaxID=1975705 RepID=UPI00187D426E|nr:PH domain-containing protein [Psychrobacter sp. FDAARGOS_221]